MSRAGSAEARAATERAFTRAVAVLYLNLFVQWFVITGACVRARGGAQRGRRRWRQCTRSAVVVVVVV